MKLRRTMMAGEIVWEGACPECGCDITLHAAQFYGKKAAECEVCGWTRRKNWGKAEEE